MNQISSGEQHLNISPVITTFWLLDLVDSRIFGEVLPQIPP